jgi:F-type H+-transporting ATPase subunit gamma
MASLKEVRGRIISVNSTQQITKAMKMVAAAKLRRAQDNIIKIRPYAEKLNTILNNLSATLDDAADNPFSIEREVKNVLIVVVTSDRGLAGAFNSNIVKGAMNLINEKYKSLGKSNVTVLCIGKKGLDFFSKKEFKVISNFSTTFHSLNFDASRKAAEFAMTGFTNNEFDRVEIVYNEFKNVATQILSLPLPRMLIIYSSHPKKKSLLN